MLVTTASKHGATDEIGKVIADRLAGAHVDAGVCPVDGVTTLDGYGAVVLGSAVATTSSLRCRWWLGVSMKPSSDTDIE